MRGILSNRLDKSMKKEIQNIQHIEDKMLRIGESGNFILELSL